MQYKADLRVEFGAERRALARRRGLRPQQRPDPRRGRPVRCAGDAQDYGSVEYSAERASMTGLCTVASTRRYAGLLRPDSAPISAPALQSKRRTAASSAGGTSSSTARRQHSHFDLSFVPDVNRREEAGAFVTDDITSARGCG